MQPESPEQNKKDAVEMAAAIFKVMSNPEILATISPEKRHQVCMEKFKNFGQAFPLVMAKMAIETRYNEKAFIMFLEKLQRDPGKGMEGVMERQADYAKFLYIEEQKAAGKHYSSDIARKVWETEYADMNKWAKNIKKQEEEARNTYEEDEKKYLQERRNELLQYIRTTDPGEFKIDITNFEEKFKDIPHSEESGDYEPEHKDMTISQPPTEVDKHLYDAIQKRRTIEESARDSQWLNNAALNSWNSKKSKKICKQKKVKK